MRELAEMSHDIFDDRKPAAARRAFVTKQHPTPRAPAQRTWHTTASPCRWRRAWDEHPSNSCPLLASPVVQFVLASASPPGCRSCAPRARGEVEVSDLDEDACSPACRGVGRRGGHALAGAKATAVARRVADRLPTRRRRRLRLDAHIGGSWSASPATRHGPRRWQEMAGNTGDLVTGHAVSG